MLRNILIELIPFILVSGGAKGADSLAEDFAKIQGIPRQIYEADWKKFGKSAGFIRNQSIVNNSDMIIAFWDGHSRGTADTLNKAKIEGVPTLIVYF